MIAIIDSTVIIVNPGDNSAVGSVSEVDGVVVVVVVVGGIVVVVVVVDGGVVVVVVVVG